MKQVFYPYTLWEEWHYGMWHQPSVAETAELLPLAVAFTGDHRLYGKWMVKVLAAWPISCEHNLTNVSINRKAWVGHAACCLATGIPESVTRKAWGELTKKQQDAANDMAQRAIVIFEGGYDGRPRQYGFPYEAPHKGMDSLMGGERIPLRDTGRSTSGVGAVGKGTLVQAGMSRHSQERHHPVIAGIL